jgi:hypothetical protein
MNQKLTMKFYFLYLQGSCTAGSLPVAWINEGPGPPLQCRQSCHQLYHVNDRYNQNNKDTLKTSNDNKINANTNNNKLMNKSYNNNFSNKSNNYKSNNEKNINMKNRFNENRQCLDYLEGDNNNNYNNNNNKNDENSPSKICIKSSSDIETKLKTIHLRHCCERDVASALHNDAYNDVLNGGNSCKMRLNELIEVDKLAERLTCEFMEILVRYDCGHRYSLIHDCGVCKVSIPII